MRVQSARHTFFKGFLQKATCPLLWHRRIVYTDGKK